MIGKGWSPELERGFNAAFPTRESPKYLKEPVRSALPSKF
jgi:hypothetical protein